MCEREQLHKLGGAGGLCVYSLLNVCFYTDINEHITTDEPSVRDTDVINTIIMHCAGPLEYLSLQRLLLVCKQRACVKEEKRDELQCKGLDLSLINIKPVSTALTGTDQGFYSSGTNICSPFSACFY